MSQIRVVLAVVPENAIQAEPDASSGELACARAANSGECLRNEVFSARASPDLRGTRVLQPRTANANEPLEEFKPRSDSDDANRRLAESRSSFLPMDARLDVAPALYVPAKDERGAVRQDILHFLARVLATISFDCARFKLGLVGISRAIRHDILHFRARVLAVLSAKTSCTTVREYAPLGLRRDRAKEDTCAVGDSVRCLHSAVAAW